MAAAGAAKEDRELVADQLAATVGEDRRQADQARPVLLASVGRGPSDTPGVRGDSTADLGAAVTGGVRAGGLPGRKGSEEKKEGRWSVRELGPKRTKVAGWHPTGRRTAHFPRVLVQFRRSAAKNLVAIEATCRILLGTGRPKWKSQINSLLGGSGSA